MARKGRVGRRRRWSRPKGRNSSKLKGNLKDNLDPITSGDGAELRRDSAASVASNSTTDSEEVISSCTNAEEVPVALNASAVEEPIGESACVDHRAGDNETVQPAVHLSEVLPSSSNKVDIECSPLAGTEGIVQGFDDGKENNSRQQGTDVHALRSGIYKILQPTSVTNIAGAEASQNFTVAEMELSFSPVKKVCEVPETAPAATSSPKNLPSDQLNPNAAQQSVTSFLDSVQYEVRKLLPGDWMCSIRRCRLIVQFVPTPMGTSVQRAVSVGRDGSVSIVVHNRPLIDCHEVWSKVPSCATLQSSSVGDFSKHVMNLVNSLRQFEICRGNPDQKYSRFSRRVKTMVYDDNKFREGRFSTTWRSTSCHYLISLSYKRCKACTNLKRSLDKRLKSVQKIDPHDSTNNSKLYTPQIQKKLQSERTSKRTLQKRIERRNRKIQLMIKKHGFHLDDALSSEFQDILEKNREKLSEAQSIFVKEQLKYASLTSGKGMKWHPLLIRLAIQLHSVSPACLDAINDSGVFRLPTARMLFNYTHYHKSKAGLCVATITSLFDEMAKYQGEDEHKRYHILMVDEMTISSNLVFSKSTGELVGFVDLPPIQQNIIDFQEALDLIDLGTGPLNDVGGNSKSTLSKDNKCQTSTTPGVKKAMAKKMLTFMVKGLTTPVKHVVASYGVGNLQATDLFHKTWKVIANLERNNIYVLGVVCDGCAVNRKFIKMNHPRTKLPSGVVFDTWNHCACKGKRPLYFFSDVPHLLKTIRNCFWSSGNGKNYPRTLCKNKQVIEWKTIKRLYEDEKRNTLRLAHKLNKQVVYLNAHSLMNVSYAAVVMSRSVANALVHMNYPNISETVQFIRLVNDFFDCLNGSSSLQGYHKRNGNLKPYRSVNDKRFNRLLHFLNYLNEWKEEVMAGPGLKQEKDRAILAYQTLEGIEMTIHAFISAVKFMLRDAKAPFIMARAFCQDPLEQYFSRQRASVGGNRNPNKAQFLSTQNKVRMVKGLGFRRRGNTEYVTSNISSLSERLPKLVAIRRNKKGCVRSLAYGPGISDSGVSKPQRTEVQPVHQV